MQRRGGIKTRAHTVMRSNQNGATRHKILLSSFNFQEKHACRKVTENLVPRRILKPENPHCEIV